MEKKSLVWFMAQKNCLRNKKSFWVMIFGITISIAVLVVSIVSNNKLLKTQREEIIQITGDWHVAFLYNNDSIIKEIQKMDCVKQVFQCFYIPDMYGENCNESFHILGINRNKFGDFIQLHKGRYPNKKYEILLPQWYLDMHMITELPYKIVLNGKKMSIVGSFSVNYEKTNHDIPVYLSYEENQELLPYAIQGLPWGSVFEAKNSKYIKNNKRTLLVSLKEKTDVAQVSEQIEKIKGVFPFRVKEAYEITKYEKKYTAWFNGDRIAVDHMKNAGQLTKHGMYCAQKKLQSIYEILIVVVTILYMFTCLNLKKRDILFQIGLFRTMGVSSVEMLRMQLLYFGFVMLIAVLMGLFVGIGVLIILKEIAYLDMIIVLRKLFLAVVCFFLAVLFITMCGLIQEPVHAIRKGVTDVASCTYGKGQNNMIRHPQYFKLQYALRNMKLHRMRYRILTGVIVILFCMFAISFSVVNFNEISGNGKEKCELDILLEKQNYSKRSGDKKFVEKIRQAGDVEQVLAPLVYHQSLSTKGKKQIIVKIPKSKLNKVWEKKLLLANYENYIKNQKSYVMNNTGIIGCNKEELTYLKQYVVEGKIENMYNPKKNYVLLPKYFESYENTNIPVSGYKVGDSITLSVTKEKTDLSKPEFSCEKTFIIAGFVTYNPFNMSNGVSSEFSVILNASQFEKIVPGSIDYIYVKVKDGKNEEVKKLLNVNGCDKEGYIIQDTDNSGVAKSIYEKTDKIQQNRMFHTIMGTGLIIIIALGNLIFVKKMLREDEIKELRIIGFSVQAIVEIDLIETVLYHVIGLGIGMLLSVVVLRLLNVDMLYASIENIPWTEWMFMATDMLLIGGVFSVLTSIYLERTLEIE